MNPVLIALVVGHGQDGQPRVKAGTFDPGAVANPPRKETENALVKRLAQDIARQTVPNVVFKIIEQIETPANPSTTGYWGLVPRLNTLKPNLAIALHLNAAEAKLKNQAYGWQTLYAGTDKLNRPAESVRGKRMAKILNEEWQRSFGFSGRAVPLKPTSYSENGGGLLINTTMPIILHEPWFIDNDKELDRYLADWPKVIATYCAAINRIVNEG